MRKMLLIIPAVALLSGGGMAMTVFAWRTTTLVAERSMNDPWPLAYSLYGTLALLGLVLTSLGWVIGRRRMEFAFFASSSWISRYQVLIAAR